MLPLDLFSLKVSNIDLLFGFINVLLTLRTNPNIRMQILSTVAKAQLLCSNNARQSSDCYDSEQLQVQQVTGEEICKKDTIFFLACDLLIMSIGLSLRRYLLSLLYLKHEDATVSM